MATKKNMTLPIIIAVIFLIIIIYLFATIKQTEVSCTKNYNYDANVRLVEDLKVMVDGKEIKSIVLKKSIILSDKYADDTHLNSLHASLDNTLEYLGKDVRYSIGDNYIVVKASISKDKQLVLLNNIDFQNTNDLHIIINSNTKSSDVIKLAVGDNYTEGELMMHLKNRGYTCQ